MSEPSSQPSSESAPSTALTLFTPVPRQTDRHNGWKPEVQRAFIEALAETGSVRAACRRVGRSEHGVYQMRRHPEAAEFRAAWDAALDFGVRRIEDAAMDRAINGVEETIHYHGEHVATRRRYNERLVMFILRSRLPDRFTDGGAKSPNAVDQATLARLKKEWRKEWEQEKAVSAADVRAAIDKKLRQLREQTVLNTSPPEFELHLAGAAQRRADQAAGWRAGLPYEEFAEAAAALVPRFLEEVRAEYPDYEEYVGGEGE